MVIPYFSAWWVAVTRGAQAQITHNENEAVEVSEPKWRPTLGQHWVSVYSYPDSYPAPTSKLHSQTSDFTRRQGERGVAVMPEKAVR